MDIRNDGPVIYLTTTKQGEILSINPFGVAFLHASSPDEVTGKLITDYYAHSVDRSVYLSRLGKEGKVQNFEINFAVQGKVYTCLENAVIHKILSPDKWEIESVIVDISGFVDSNLQTLKLNLELATVNKKLKDAYNTMAQQEKMASVGELAAGVAHEINNPLGFVMSNSRSLHRYIDTVKDAIGGSPLASDSKLTFVLDDLSAILKENNEGLQRIVRITESLKRFSRMDTEQRTDSYDINQAVQDTLVIAKSHYKYSAEVTTELQDIPPFSCYGDAVNQVILNLIVNASQAVQNKHKDKKGDIKIITKRVDNDAVLTVSDNGGGVPDSVAPRIFDPFFTTKEIGKGTGLGLSLCYDIIVHKHGGKIWFENNTGGGADFSIALPMEPANV